MTPEIRGEMRRLVLLHLWKIETVARRFGVHHSTVKRVLREADGQIGGPDGAAARLGLKRTTLNSKLKKLGIERGDVK